MAAGVIDLHLHTTASDGLCSPAMLVDRAWRAGITTLSVTDHDTVAALPDVERAAAAAGIAWVPGIEITATEDGRDVHVLGYFFDHRNASLRSFLEVQRADRIRRIDAMADRLTALGKDVDRAELTAQPQGASVGRPHLARALVKSGHVADVRQAFDELIGEGKPAYLPRAAATPAEVIAILAAAGGLASLAHPGILRRDDLIAGMVDAGLAAVEAFHSEHDHALTRHYLELAERLGVAVSGGSDYHGGDSGRRSAAFGTVGLPPERFDRLAASHASRVS